MDLKERIWFIYDNLDPLVKREVIYIVAGATTGLIVGIIFQKFKGKETPVDVVSDTLPRNARRRIIRFLKSLRGGDIILILKIIELINQSLAFMGVGGIIGFVSFLKSLKKNELYDLIEGATNMRAHNLALTVLFSGVPISDVKDYACRPEFVAVMRFLMEKFVPFETKKQVIDEFFTNKKLLTNAATLYCLLYLLSMLFLHDIGSFYLLIAKLRQLLREGKISHVLYRAILKGLKKGKIPLIDEAY